MNKMTIKTIYLLVFSISFCALNFSSCKNDDNTIMPNEEEDLWDITWKPGLDSNAVVFNVDGIEYVSDSCKFERFLDGYRLTAHSMEQDIFFKLILESDKLDTTNVVNAQYSDNNDKLLINNAGTKCILAIKRFDIKAIGLKYDPILKGELECDSMYVEGVFHIKGPDPYGIKEIKGQFFYKGIVGPNMWIGGIYPYF